MSLHESRITKEVHASKERGGERSRRTFLSLTLKCSTFYFGEPCEFYVRNPEVKNMYLKRRRKTEASVYKK